MTKTIVALYDTVPAAERAVRDLREAGVSESEISLMAAGAQTPLADDTQTAEKGAGLGAALGGLGGLLVGLGALTIPGIGPVMAAGPLATAVAALAGAGAGALAGGAAGGLLGALVEAGLPEEQASLYAEGVRRGGTLLAVRVPENRHDQARAILDQHNPVNVDERSSDWRKQGWTRYDPNAGPYTARPLAEAGAGVGSAAVYAHGQAAERAVESGANADYARYAPAFRGHFQTNLAQSGFQYEHYEPAYQYGLTLGHYEPYRGLEWLQIEREAQLAWEERNPNTWDRIREAVRFGWDRVRTPVR